MFNKNSKIGHIKKLFVYMEQIVINYLVFFIFVKEGVLRTQKWQK